VVYRYSVSKQSGAAASGPAVHAHEDAEGSDGRHLALLQGVDRGRLHATGAAAESPPSAAAAAAAAAAAGGQGLTLFRFSAQPEPSMTQNAP